MCLGEPSTIQVDHSPEKAGEGAIPTVGPGGVQGVGNGCGHRFFSGVPSTPIMLEMACQSAARGNIRASRVMISPGPWVWSLEDRGMETLSSAVHSRRLAPAVLSLYILIADRRGFYKLKCTGSVQPAYAIRTLSVYFFLFFFFFYLLYIYILTPA